MAQAPYETALPLGQDQEIERLGLNILALRERIIAAGGDPEQMSKALSLIAGYEEATMGGDILTEDGVTRPAITFSVVQAKYSVLNGQVPQSVREVQAVERVGSDAADVVYEYGDVGDTNVGGLFGRFDDLSATFNANWAKYCAANGLGDSIFQGGTISEEEAESARQKRIAGQALPLQTAMGSSLLGLLGEYPGDWAELLGPPDRRLSDRWVGVSPSSRSPLTPPHTAPSLDLETIEKIPTIPLSSRALDERHQPLNAAESIPAKIDAITLDVWKAKLGPYLSDAALPDEGFDLLIRAVRSDGVTALDPYLKPIDQTEGAALRETIATLLSPDFAQDLWEYEAAGLGLPADAIVGKIDYTNGKRVQYTALAFYQRCKHLLAPGVQDAASLQAAFLNIYTGRLKPDGRYVQAPDRWSDKRLIAELKHLRQEARGFALQAQTAEAND